MANSALIDDLLKQFAENPRRVFARLANEYRKAGELDAAIQICRSFVPQQPTYISGYIVLGQALYESGKLDEARSTFETALGLDPENLIALRQLGDIAHARGDLAGARSWYQRLLEVDPQNEEVAEQLRAMDAPAAPSSGGAPGAAAAAASPVSWSDINPEQASPAPQPSAPAPIELDLSALTPVAPPPPPPPAAFAPEAPSASAASDPFDFGFPEPAVPPPPPAPMASAPVEAEPVSYMPPVPVDPFMGSSPFDRPEPVAAADVPAVEHPAARAPQRVVRPTEELPAADDGASATFVTETMAELYLQQGFTDQALTIYRQLAAQRPDDSSLRQRVAELEHAGAPRSPAGQSVRTFFGGFALRRPPSAPVVAEPGALAAPAPVREPEPQPEPEPVAPPEPELVSVSALASVAYEEPVHEEPEEVPAPSAPSAPPAAAAAEPALEGTDGLQEMFAERIAPAADEDAASTLAGAFSEEYTAPAAPITGEPARAASDPLSLDNVFRDGRPRTPPRGTAQNVSFDEFFSRRESGEIDAAAENGTADGAGEGSAHPAAGGGDGEKDLELFHAWLEGLKK